MRQADKRDDIAFRAAHLYYLQDLTMDAVARELETSRSTVSRLLSYAKESGIVAISLNDPTDSGTAIAAEIARAYGVSAHIVPIPAQASEIDRLDRVAMTAARILGEFFHPTMRLGIAWGSTMTAISRHLGQRQTPNSTIVQLNGAGNNRTTGIEYASEILRRFGDAFGSTVEQLPVPAFFDDPATRAAMWRERSLRRVLALQASVDVALFSVGSPLAQVPSHVYMGGYLDASDYAGIRRDGAVGDVATVFFRADGSHEGIAINARATGPSFTTLRRAGRRICVISGAEKVPSLRGALAARLITDLVIDESAARALADAAR